MGWILVYHLPCPFWRAWYNGSTSASQAEDEGSIPFARTIRLRLALRRDLRRNG